MDNAEKKETAVTTTAVYHEEDQVESMPHPAELGHQQPLVERYWLWEFFAWIACTAALLGMVAFLVPLNQKPVPKWVLSGTVKDYTLGFSVSINSVLSIFSAIVSSAVMIPVAASIGQLKWMWFAEGQKLSDFAHFEGANGGPLGAVTLLWAMRGRRLVCLGALIIIAALALDFSFQQLVTYPPAPKQVSKAWMPATATYSNYAVQVSGIAQIEFPIPDRSMSTALKIGLNGIAATVNVEPDCTTGNCTWPNAITTLGVCSECFDATPTLKKTCTATPDSNGILAESCTWSYPNGLSLSDQLDEYNVYTIFATSGEMTNTAFFQNMTAPIAILSTIGNTHNASVTTDVFGTQCALFWCVQKYDAVINKTVVTEKLVDTYRDDSATVDSATGDFVITAPEQFMNGTNHNGSSAFMVSANASSAFSVFFVAKSNLLGSITRDPLQHGATPTDMMSYLWPLDNAGITQAMSWLAGNMTNVIRMANKAASAENVLGNGVTWQDVPKVNVVWPWIAIPAGLVFLSLLFLTLTMIASSKRNAILWKSSPLAPFYHPLADDGRKVLSQAGGPKELVHIAQNLRVKSERTEKGPRLVKIE